MTITFAVLFVGSMALNMVMVWHWFYALRRWRDEHGERIKEAHVARFANQYFLRCMRAEDQGRDPRVDADAQRAYRSHMVEFRKHMVDDRVQPTIIERQGDEDATVVKIGDTPYSVRWEGWRLDDTPTADN